MYRDGLLVPTWWYGAERRVDEAGQHEAMRLAALHSLGILDTAVESDYDDLTALAAAICGTPIAAVSLVDAERQWFKSQTGLGVRETSREVSFCAHAIQTPGELFVVPDATADERFAGNALVTGDPSIRFYAGAPLVTRDGTALGSLCVIDRRPRQLTEEQYSALATLARQVTRLIEHRVATRSLMEAVRGQEAAEKSSRIAVSRFRRAFTLSASGMLVVAPDGRITQSNPAFADHLGRVSEDLVGQLITDITSPGDILSDRELACDLLAGTSQQVRREKHFLTVDGTPVPALVTSCVIPASADGDLEFLNQVEWLTEQRRAEERLLETQSAVDAIISVDAAGRVISWNDGAVRMFGYERDSMLGRSVSTIVSEHMVDAHEAGMAGMATSAPGRPIGTTVDVSARRQNGSEFPVEFSLSSWERGGSRYCTAILRDVTAPRRTAALVALTRHAATVANDCAQLDEAITRLLPALAAAGPANVVRGWLRSPGRERDGAPLWTSTGHHCLDGVEASTVLSPPGRFRPAQVSPTDDPEEVGVIASEGGQVILPVPVLLDGDVCGVLALEGTADLAADVELHDALGQVGTQLGRVAERARTATELTVRSLTDPLTGLANRRRMLELLQQVVDRGVCETADAVLFLDLDQFKVINDTLGHTTGDEVLRGVAARLTGLLREGDTLARMGGDEFVVLCTGLPDELLAEWVADRVLGAFTEPFTVDSTPLYLSASIGIAATTGEADAATLLRHADIAMYRAKALGGSAYAVFDTQMDDSLRRRLDTKNALYQALPRAELVVHYQPILRLADNHVLGLEALVRWERPGHGLVLPADFIPLAEETGLIVPIGAHVLRQACSQMAAWRAERPELTGAYIAVNVAAAQLHTDFFAVVADALRTTGLPPQQLTVEITESAMLVDLTRTSELLSDLRRLGVKVAL